MQPDLIIDAETTALVVIDVLNFTLGVPLAPHDASTILANTVRLVEAFRAAGALVVLVRVDVTRGPAFTPPVDAVMPTFTFPPGAGDFPPSLEPQAGDLVITKSRWNAFRDTELDSRLRARGVRTIVLTGIATNFGVEGTLRGAHESGYAQIVPEDACAAFSAEEHDFPMRTVFPRAAKVRSTDQVCAALAL